MINLYIPSHLEYSVPSDLFGTQWLFFHCTSLNFCSWYIFPYSYSPYPYFPFFIVLPLGLLQQAFNLIWTRTLIFHWDNMVNPHSTWSPYGMIFKINHTHVKKVGHTPEFLFGIYWWTWKATIHLKNCWSGPI